MKIRNNRQHIYAEKNYLNFFQSFPFRKTKALFAPFEKGCTYTRFSILYISNEKHVQKAPFVS
ncbi:hypothetical protein ACRCJ1_03610, partial [Aerococcus sp. L_4]